MLEVPERGMIHKGLAALLMLSTKQRQQFALRLGGWRLPGKTPQAAHHERQLPYVFAAESTHHEVQPHLEADRPRQRPVKEVARALCNLSAIQHVTTLCGTFGRPSALFQGLLNDGADPGPGTMQEHP